MTEAAIGVIGGSGLYQIEALKQVEKISIETPFGAPSDDYLKGTLSGRTVIFLARHGRGHRLLPSEINYRANIWGMKKLGVKQIISVSAVGSLKEEIRPGEFVYPDQFIDRTTRRVSTFFGEGVVAHVSLADPVCSGLRHSLVKASEKTGIVHHPKGTYLCMEGPQFSTKAESNLYRSWNCDIIGMTNFTEAKLAREAQLCYATVGLATDYDCWHPNHDSVTTDQILATLFSNIKKAKELLIEVIPFLEEKTPCQCQRALHHAIATDKLMISDSTKQRLKLIFEK